MSRLYGHKCYTRWSDPILRKQCSLYRTPTSEEDISSIHRSRSSSPLLSATNQRVTSKGGVKCCLCHNECRRNSSKSSGNRNKKSSCSTCEEPRRARESLQLYLAGTEVEEALADDKGTVLLQHLDLTTTVFEALAQYVQSLRMSQLAAYRVLTVSHLLTLSHRPAMNYANSDPTHLAAHLRQLDIQKESRLAALQDLMGHCTKYIGLPKQFCALMDDHCTRKKDFYTAARNLKNLLEDSKLSISQMEKLRHQYDSILHDYQESRHILDMELPKVVNTRLIMLQQSFEKVRGFCEDTDSVNHTVALFKLIQESLHQSTLNAGMVQVSQDLISQNSELCQKCKVNRVDKK